MTNQTPLCSGNYGCTCAYYNQGKCTLTDRNATCPKEFCGASCDDCPYCDLYNGCTLGA